MFICCEVRGLLPCRLVESWLATHTHPEVQGNPMWETPWLLQCVLNKRLLLYTISVNMQANPVWLLDKSTPPASLLSLYFGSCCSTKMTFPVLPCLPWSESPSLQVPSTCLLLRGANSSDSLP